MMQRTACITLRVRAKRDLSRCTRTCGSAASVERNGLWREAPNKVRACALWPVAFHRHKTGGDALSCPPDPPGDHRQDADATSPLHACILGEGVVD